MAEYRIAELADATDTAVRNIRVYQDRGILPPPRREGKIALYSDDHLVRLRLVNRLLERGYTLGVIRDLVDAWADGRNLEDVLGLESATRPEPRDERPEPVTLAELQRLHGGQATPDLLERAIALGVLARTGPTTFEILEPRPFAAGVEMVAAGIPLTAVLDLSEGIRDDQQRTADRIVDLVGGHLLPADGPGALPAADDLHDAVESIARLRPHAAKTVAAYFARGFNDAIQRTFEELVARASKHTQGDGDADAPSTSETS
ncbi:MerR family transcriptional regulator [Cryptosporangium aurantiacum]|uniref:MerR HTH family regulatory protein n=1 Tax=Cryptosporangium aurantiacum TaxID=134849 RepID=A0A1M7Q2X9_9ACTN|nr:MerR family transcriptional regulator [Cryptosporangium aurantiacum]SHN24537.1 MerR HTH family regulatory protein [Cryptosporangium aurantiacum]